MYAFLITIHVLASIFLIAVILLQAGRGSGLSEGFGGGAMQNIFGSSSTTVLTKVTAGCAIVFIITSLTLTIMATRRGKSLIELQKGKVSDIVTQQKKPVTGTAVQPVDNKTVTVREVKIDPATGKEIVVKEEKMTPEEAAAKQKQQPAPVPAE